MGERSIRRDGKGGAILSQALQPHFVAGALAFFLGGKGVLLGSSPDLFFAEEWGAFGKSVFFMRSAIPWEGVICRPQYHVLFHGI